MIAGPIAPGVGEFRYQPGSESGSSSDGTSTDPSGLRPSSISGELMPMAGTERKAGGDAANTGPIDQTGSGWGPAPGCPTPPDPMARHWAWESAASARRSFPLRWSGPVPLRKSPVTTIAMSRMPIRSAAGRLPRNLRHRRELPPQLSPSTQQLTCGRRDLLGRPDRSRSKPLEGQPLCTSRAAFRSWADPVAQPGLSAVPDQSGYLSRRFSILGEPAPAICDHGTDE